jgi:hypothetical protein
MSDTYETVHAGDIVLGHDGQLWGIGEITREPQLSVTLVRGAARVVGYPPAGTPITVVQRADVELERHAVGNLLAAGLGIELISEHWESGS